MSFFFLYVIAVLVKRNKIIQEWFTVTDSRGRARDRYLFLFKARILVTKVRRVTDDRNLFLLKDIIKVKLEQALDSDNSQVD